MKELLTSSKIKQVVILIVLPLVVYSCSADYSIDRNGIVSNRVFDQGFIMEKLIVDSISTGVKQDTLFVDSTGNIVQKFYHQRGIPVTYSVDTLVILNKVGDGNRKAIYFDRANPGYNWIVSKPLLSSPMDICPIEPQNGCWYRIRGLRGEFDAYTRVLFVFFHSDGNVTQYIDEHSGPF